MTELEKFNSIWKFDGQRAKAKQKTFEDVLFAIWRTHPDKNGIQINPSKIKGTSERTVYMVIELAEKAGLLNKTRGYSVGKFYRHYRKNKELFNSVFRKGEKKYDKWLEESRKVETSCDKLAEEIEKTDIVKLTNLDGKREYKRTRGKRRKWKPEKMPYDLEKLHELSKTMLPRYRDIVVKLNGAAVHEGLKFTTFLYFDEFRMPTGRPTSYFNLTRNDAKRGRKRDTAIENRSDFLKRAGIAGYREVYDINSEVPRVAYLFHTGKWKPKSYDFYAEIIKDAGLTDADGRIISRNGSRETDYGDGMKAMFMRIYFESYSDKNSFRLFESEMIKRFEDEDWSVGELIAKRELLVTKKDWPRLCESTRKIVGTSIGPLVFWYTFFIEAEVLLELLKRGKKVYSVYDGFYYDKDIGGEIDILVRKKALFVYKNYMKTVRL
jgi:AcrR family transcriptional regulator